MSDVAQAMRDGRITLLDERGLMPLDVARGVLAAENEFGPWQGRAEITDRMWAALLSLDGADEFVREASRLRWSGSPRGMYNVAPFERYGAGIFPWLAAHLQGEVLVDVPWCVAPCLARVGTREAFEIVLSAKTLETTSYVFGTPEKLLGAMLDAFPRIGWPLLAERALAAAGDAALFKKLVKGRSRGALTAIEEALGRETRATIERKLKISAKLEAPEILALFDAAAASDSWPVFNHDFESTLEYTALRLVAARDGDRWGVALERLTGGDWDHFGIQRFVFGSEITPGRADDEPSPEVTIEGPAEYDADSAVGSTIRGPAGAITLTKEDVKALDLKPGKGTEPDSGAPQLVLLRAYVARFAGAIFRPVEETMTALRMAGVAPMLVTESFAHVPESPSASKTYKSLAAAIVANDPALFVPGKSNTDWRKHLVK